MGLKLFQGHRHRCRFIQLHKLLRDTRHLGILDQRFAALGLFDLFGTGQQLFKTAIFIDQLRGSLDTDTRNARHIIGAVPCQRLHINNLIRCNAEFLDHFIRADKLALHRVKHAHIFIDKLHQVFIGRYNHNLLALRFGKLGVRRDQIIGFVTFKLNRRNIKGFRRRAYQRELRDQIFGRFIAVGFVLRVNFVAEIRARGIKDNRHIWRVIIIQHLQQHIHKTEYRRYWHAVRIGHGRAAAPVSHCKICPENKTRTVDEV